MSIGYTEDAVVPPPRPTTQDLSTSRQDRIAETLARAEGQLETSTDNSGTTQNVNPAPPRTDASANAVKPQRLNDVYMWERADPKHRMGNYLYHLNQEWIKLPPEQKKTPFLAWVDAIGVADFTRIIGTAMPELAGKLQGSWAEHLQLFQRGVKYKAETNLREKYVVKAEGSLLKRRGKTVNGKWVDTGKLEPLDTGESSSHWSGGGWAIWVESTSKTFYTNRMKLLKFQHTSFLAGTDVLGAGEWFVEGGTLKQISGRSGHYQPTLDHLLQALRDLEAMNVAGLDNVDVVLFRRPIEHANAQVLVKWRDLKTVAQPNQQYKVDPKAA